ncbi:MAG: hypothetical protein IH595_02050 [Bacteroidales bacterium]|nr:hypothetical protein [Bacteroidales bacterium]
MKAAKFFSLGGLIMILFFLGSCGIVNQARELERFSQCKFSVSSMALERVSGIDVSHVKSASDLNFKDMIVFSRGFLEGKLPAEAIFNVSVTNSSGKKAAVSGMEWKVVQKQQVIATGKLIKAIVVPGHGHISFDLNADLNLAAILRLNSVDQIMSIISGNVDAKTLQKLEITIQLKPYYQFDGKIKKYPGYFTITPEDLGQ